MESQAIVQAITQAKRFPIELGPWHAAVFKDELARAGAADAQLVKLGAGREPGHALQGKVYILNQVQGSSSRPVIIMPVILCQITYVILNKQQYDI